MCGQQFVSHFICVLLPLIGSFYQYNSTMYNLIHIFIMFTSITLTTEGRHFDSKSNYI